MGGPKGPMRGRKTHRADQLINRGAHELPEAAFEEPKSDGTPSGKQHKLADEHPTGRMRATGRQPDNRNRQAT